MADMSVLYPITGSHTPASEDVTRRRVEAARRARVKARNPGKVPEAAPAAAGKDANVPDAPLYTITELEKLYRQCCRAREELPLKRMRVVFQDAARAAEEKRRTKVNAALSEEERKREEQREKARARAEKGKAVESSPVEDPSSPAASQSDVADSAALIAAVEARFPPASLTATLTTLDLSFLVLDRPAIDPLADFLSVDFGLKKLIFDHCGLTDDGLKAILHALLISGTLPHLSLAANKSVRYIGWRYLSGFLRRAQNLVSLDISENSLTRPALEAILASFVRSQAELEALSLHHASHRAAHEHKDKDAASSETRVEGKENKADNKGKAPATGQPHDAEEMDDDGQPLFAAAPLLRPNLNVDGLPPVSNVQSLRLENCNLRSSSMLEVVAKSLRFSTLKHLSLRRNRLGHSAATGTALALLLRDYPDDAVSAADEAARVIDLAHEVSLSGNGPGTPGFAAVAAMVPLKPVSQEQPIALPPLAGPKVGVTLPVGSRLENALKRTATDPSELASEAESLSPAALAAAQERLFSEAKRARRVLGDLPRFGCLLTLDLKSNDLRGMGAAALAGALKKNRTLRVLNLSDNGLDVPALVLLAEGLRGNTVLETLDVSHNACGGPGLEGIHALRQVFALRTGLKRLFLNDTDVSSQGAIALAEFIPEAKSLLHLDLTENYNIDLAGAMALSVALRLNKSIRCLDLHIPPNEPDCARLSQDIFNSCVRNTQAAQERARSKGANAIAAPIYRSTLARTAQQSPPNAGEGKARSPSWSNGPSSEAARQLVKTVQHDTGVDGRRKADMDTLLEAATQCRDLLQQFRDLQRSGGEQEQEPADEETWRAMGDVVRQAARVRVRLAQAVEGMDEGRLLERVLALSDQLEALTLDLRQIRQRRKLARQGQLPGPSGSASAPGASFAPGPGPNPGPSPGSGRGPGQGPGSGVATGAGAGTASGRRAAAYQPRATPERAQRLGVPPVAAVPHASPTFSIGSDEDDDEPLENLVPRPTPARRETAEQDSPALLGLGLEGGSDEDPAEVGQDEDAERDTEPDPVDGEGAALAGAGADAQPERASTPLRITTSLPPVGSPHSHSPTEARAKGQINEEGAMFRRAKALEAEEAAHPEPAA